MVDLCISPSRAALLAAGLVLLAVGCAPRNERRVVVESSRTVVTTTAEPDPATRWAATAPTTTRESVVVTETVVYDQGEPHYPGTYFAGGRGGGGGGGGGGGPSDVLPGFGPYGRYRVGGPFLLGLAIDWAAYEFDSEDFFLPGPQDAEVESVGLTAWGEYEFQALARSGFASRVRPFIGAGVGVGFLNGDTVSVPLTSGLTLKTEVDGDLELIPGTIAGVRIDLTTNVVLELGARYDYHFTDLEINHSPSGFSTDVDDFDTFGGYVGLQFRW